MPARNALNIAVHQHDARLRGPGERFAWLESQSREQAGQGLDLLVFPELFMTGYNVGGDLLHFAEAADGGFAQRAKALAHELGVAILYGYPERSDEAIFNSAIFIDADGKVLANHRKSVLPDGIEPDYFQTGSTLTMFTFKSAKVALMICYECEFPETVRSVAASGAEVVLVCTATQWTQVPDYVVPSRAFENGVFMVYANPAGPENGTQFPGRSCIVDPYGNDLARAGGEEAVISAQLDIGLVKKAQMRLPFLRDYQKVPTAFS